MKSKTAIVNKLHYLADNPDNPDLDTAVLNGRVGWRLRVGKFRVICTRQDDMLIIEVVNVDGTVKSPDAALRCIPRHCDVPLSTPHSSGLARLACELFTAPSENLTFYEFINVRSRGDVYKR